MRVFRTHNNSLFTHQNVFLSKQHQTKIHLSHAPRLHWPCKTESVDLFCSADFFSCLPYYTKHHYAAHYWTSLGQYSKRIFDTSSKIRISGKIWFLALFTVRPGLLVAETWLNQVSPAPFSSSSLGHELPCDCPNPTSYCRLVESPVHRPSKTLPGKVFLRTQKIWRVAVFSFSSPDHPSVRAALPFRPISPHGSEEKYDGLARSCSLAQRSRLRLWDSKFGAGNFWNLVTRLKTGLLSE